MTDHYMTISDAAIETGIPENLIRKWCSQRIPMPYLPHGANQSHKLVSVARLLEYAKTQELGYMPVAEA